LNLYITADKIGTPTGGGAVTFHEYRALESLGAQTLPIDANIIPGGPDPFQSDANYRKALEDQSPNLGGLAHIYAGCFTGTVETLRSRGTRVSYTAAAHDINESRREFEELGYGFNFPHLVDPELWKRYLGGYLGADLVICPSAKSAKLMTQFGCKNVIVIPHGCILPKTIVPLPKRFTVGYLGQAGPDKGLRYLFEAWKKLDMRDGTLLIAGNNIDQALPLYRKFGGGNVQFMGFVRDVSEFFNKTSVYVQPSVTEGFGIEILEAMAHGRPVVASSGAGASEVVAHHVAGVVVPPRSSQALAEGILWARKEPRAAEGRAQKGLEAIKNYTWETIKARYVEAWNGLLPSVRAGV
jgi:glycosyltransferase involved in cell wall biosynthesis